MQCIKSEAWTYIYKLIGSPLLLSLWKICASAQAKDVIDKS